MVLRLGELLDPVEYRLNTLGAGSGNHVGPLGLQRFGTAGLGIRLHERHHLPGPVSDGMELSGGTFVLDHAFNSMFVVDYVRAYDAFGKQGGT